MAMSNVRYGKGVTQEVGMVSQNQSFCVLVEQFRC